MTIKDIAKALNVNPSTVSRALNDSDKVSEKTRELIKKYAAENGFSFNNYARSLVTSKTNRVALVISNHFSSHLTEHFFRKLNSLIIEKLEREGIEVIIYTAYNSFDGKSNIEKILRKNFVDGVIFAHSQMTHNEYELIKKSEIPHIFLYYQHEFLDKEDNFFGSDNFLGGALAFQYLYSKKCKNLISLTIETQSLEFRERSRGFREKGKELGVESIKEYSLNLNLQEVRKFISENKKNFQESDGIFIQSDHLYLMMMDFFRESSMVDKRVIGYDNMEILDYFTPRIATIDQNMEDMITTGVKYLLTILKNIPEKRKFYNSEPYLVQGGNDD